MWDDTILGHTDAVGNWSAISAALQVSTPFVVRGRERDHEGASNHHDGVQLRDKENHVGVTARWRAEGQAPEERARQRNVTRALADMQTTDQDARRSNDLLKGLSSNGAS